MLNDIREWISDYLRYILLGVAGLLLLLIIIFAVRLFTGKGSGEQKKEKEQKEQQTEQDTQAADVNTPITAAGDALERNQVDVLDLVTRFYTAKLNKDQETLNEICEVTSDGANAGYEAMDDVIESYNNLITYSKAGLTEGSYVVFAYFDAKLTGIDTLVPTLRGLYLFTNEEGNLIISNTKSHPDQEAYQQQVWTDDDVQVLRKDVADQYEASLEQDEDLAQFVESMKADTGSNGGDTSDGDSGDDADAGDTDAGLGTMYASTGVNVRGEPNAESTLYGTLMTGMQVEVLENLDNGWSRISYVTSDGTTIEGYMMTQYLTDTQ